MSGSTTERGGQVGTSHRRRAEQFGGGSVDTGTLAITLTHPSTAFLYRATSPRLRIDDADIDLAGWGSHRLPVAPGRHRVQVWVPYAIPREAGKAHTEVTVASGQDIELEYVAPTITFGRGSLGPPGEQRSAGWSGVMAFNVVAVVAVLLTLAVVFL